MDIKEYENKSKTEIDEAIRRREENKEALEPFKGWHFEKNKQYRAIEKSIAKLQALKERLGIESSGE